MSDACYPAHGRESKCRDIDVTVYGVRTWNNWDVSGEYFCVSRYHPVVITFSLYFYFIICVLPLRDDEIYSYHFCVLHLEYLKKTISAKPKTRGIGDFSIHFSRQGPNTLGSTSVSS